MKNLLNPSTSVLLCLLAICLTSFAPEGKPKFKDLWKPIGDNVYASVTETTVFNYREFLADIRTTSDQWEQYQFDTSIWDRHHKSFQDIEITYVEHPAFDSYPILGISHEGAKAYCRWLTDKMNESPKKPFQKVVYRLPTEAEWEKAARADLKDAEFPWQVIPGREVKQLTQDKKGNYRCNFKVIDQSYIHKSPDSKESIIVGGGANLSHDQYMLTAPAVSFEPNAWGLYNMAGNVSEMIDEPGIAKGGSWYSTGYYLRINSQEKYEKPLSTIGFRVFMEVIEE